MGITTREELNTHPRLGSLWEGFALEEIIRLFKTTPEESYFWATHADAELDLLLLKDGKRLGFEFKYTDSPRITKSMHVALEDLNLSHLAVIYPGSAIFPLSEKITAYGLETISSGEFEKSFSRVVEQ